MFKKLLATPYALFMLLFVILPIVLIAVYAFTDAEGAIDLIGNFQDLAKEESLGKVVRNSVIAGLSTAVICLVIGYPIAYYLTKSEFNRTGVLIGLFLVPMWVNFLLRMMSTKAALNALHIEMGMGTVIFGLCYEFLPFMIMPIYTTIQKIDKSLIEGATDLGATPTKAFWKVTVPLSLPGVLSGLTMVVIPSITTFAVTEILSNGKLMLLGDFIYNLKAYNLNMASAISLVLMILLGISMLITNKFNKDETNGGGLW